MSALRTISDEFMGDLQGGLLRPVAEQVRHDDTLMLALRGTYINVYYRGGNILKLDRNGSGKYRTDFNKRHFLGAECPDLPTQLVASPEDVSAWLTQFPRLKAPMDRHRSAHKHAEREFQQLVAWENNRSSISNETEYFITDIEFAINVELPDEKRRVRIDMLGVRWPSHERQTQWALVPVLIEMKYGNQAMAGSSGLRKHLSDIARILETEKKKEVICETIEGQFRQLRELQLIDYNQSSRFESPRLSAAKPQVIFLLANCNPRSSTLKSLLSELRELEDDHSHFDLRFFVATFSGYGMHHASMLDASEFSAIVDRLLTKRSAS